MTYVQNSCSSINYKSHKPDTFDTRHIPGIWKHACICLINKKGSQHDPANYQPVSLTCICCRLLERILHSHISAHLDQFNLLTDVSLSFLAKRSCETQLFCTINDFAQNYEKNLTTNVMISKVFDCVIAEH